MSWSTKEVLAFIGFLIAAYTLGSFNTYVVMRNSYRTALEANAEEHKNQMLANMMIHKKLNQCAVEFGTYIATKGKNGQRYFEHY